MSEVQPSRPSVQLLQLQAEERRRREAEAERIKRGRSAAVLRRHHALLGIWLYGSFFLPVLVMMLMGDELDRALHGAGPFATVLTLASPIAISMIFAKDILVDVILHGMFDREMYALDPSEHSLFAPKPASDRRFLIMKLWSAGSVIVPVLILWIASGSLDRALASLGAGRGLLAIAIPFACWAFVRWIVIGRILKPRHLLACDTESKIRHERWLADIDRERAARDVEFDAKFAPKG